MNYIIIYATILLLKGNKKPIRIFLASLIGAFYAIVSVMQLVDILNSVIIKILVSVIIIYVAMDTKNFKELLKAVIVFYLVSFTFGGIALALLYFVKPENIFMKNGVYIGTYPIKIVLLGGIVGYILVSIVYSIIKNKYKQRKKICEIEICIEKNVKTVVALIDSGNFLKEPITGTPVIVVETSCLFGIIPDDILKNIDNIIMGSTDFLSLEDTYNNNNNINNNTNNNNHNNSINEYINRFRVIPFNSLGKENGLLLGLKADYIKVVSDIGIDGFDNNMITNIIIALYDKKISKERFI